MLTMAARKIRATREAYGLTQAQFGARYGVNKQRVYKWETGLNAIPSPDLVNRMHEDGIVDRNDWFVGGGDAPLLCGTCDRRIDDAVNVGCSRTSCPRHLFQDMMEKGA